MNNIMIKMNNIIEILMMITIMIVKIITVSNDSNDNDNEMARASSFRLGPRAGAGPVPKENRNEKLK